MATAADLGNVELRLLDDGDRCNSFSLGDGGLTPLKTYLLRQAKQHHLRHLARTFVIVRAGQNTVLAYASILCTQIRVSDVAVAGGEEDFPYKDFPALRLARLAVDRRYQGTGMGALLVDFILSLAREQIMPHVGCRFLVLDAKPGSVAFYERKGFSKIGEVQDGANPLTLMFVDLYRLAV